MAFTRSGVRFPSPPLRRNKGRTEADGTGGDGHGGPVVARGWVRYIECHAGIAQLVEHNLAKVGVAGSSPVSRSRQASQATRGGAAW